MAEKEERQALAAMGATQADIDAVIAAGQDYRQHDAQPSVQPANLLIVSLFMQVNKYWYRAGMEGRPTYLDPVAVEQRASKLRWYQGLTDEMREWVWDGLDAMANTALDVWREQNA
ncbi:hypothetical protein [Bowmanella denitrificans]|uniref:hypothetical protein n=1 Tax=Bowmanella denitrificans TaxID=366582 RepID=UPI000C9AFDC0|nr:hypothetical protein [Bowmanella denitrificans]